MTKQTKTELAVAALREGTVIDHIPPQSLFKVVDLLGLQKVSNSVTIGYNLDSKRMGKKGIIKVAGLFFPEETLNRIAVIAPDVVINIIRDYEVVEKLSVTLPGELVDIVRCSNPKCISNNEPMHTRFHVVDDGRTMLRCHYCERVIAREEAVLK